LGAAFTNYDTTSPLSRIGKKIGIELLKRAAYIGSHLGNQLETIATVGRRIVIERRDPGWALSERIGGDAHGNRAQRRILW